jgi:heme/copper-type cytochrome/quinol oxidase subunit 4
VAFLHANSGVEQRGSLAASIFSVCVAFIFVCVDGKWGLRAVV